MEDKVIRYMADPPNFSFAKTCDDLQQNIQENPCAEQVMGEPFRLTTTIKGTIGRDMNGLKHIKTLEGEWIMTREWLDTDVGEVVDIKHIASYHFNLGERSSELSVADVWDITLTVTLITGDEYDITNLKQLVKFTRSLDGDNSSFRNSSAGTLAYYVANAMEHDEMTKEAKKFNG